MERIAVLGCGAFDRITMSFVRYIGNYRRTMRSRVKRLLAEHGRHARLVTLTSRRHTARFLRELGATVQAQT